MANNDNNSPPKFDQFMYAHLFCIIINIIMLLGASKVRSVYVCSSILYNNKYYNATRSIKLHYFANEVEIGETHDILVGALPPSTIP